jgi:hypothetical protein
MKLLRSAGLILGLAMFTMAIFAVGSAAAEPTKLCSSNEEHCSKEKTLSGNWLTSFAAPGTKPATGASMSMSSLPTVTCTTSKFNSQELESSGGPLIGKLSYWYNEGCSGTEATGCKMGTVVESPSSLPVEIVNTSGGNGTIKVTKPLLNVECTSPKFQCTFTKATMEFTLTGGAPAKIDTTSALTKTAGACPSTATFKATYSVADPLSVFVTN